MTAFLKTGATVALDATDAGAVAAAVSASALLLSNSGATWLQFSFLTTDDAPDDLTTDGGYIPVAPNTQLVVAVPGNGRFWGAFGGGILLVTPGSA